MDLIKLEFDKTNDSLIKIKEYQGKYKLDQNQIQEICRTKPLISLASNYYTAQLQNDAEFVNDGRVSIDSSIHHARLDESQVHAEQDILFMDELVIVKKCDNVNVFTESKN
jgi:hypothetical protein